ncbi:hypothetical protein BH11PSE8_BH11PSE8_12410 [soil metagenome]
MSSSLVCPLCEHSNPPASRFCNECGAALEATPAVAGDSSELAWGGVEVSTVSPPSVEPAGTEAVEPPPSALEPRPFSVHFEPDGSVSLKVAHAAAAGGMPLAGDAASATAPQPAIDLNHEFDPLATMVASAAERLTPEARTVAHEPGMVASPWHEPEPEMAGHPHPANFSPRVTRPAVRWAGAALVLVLAGAAGWWGLRPGSAPISAGPRAVPLAISAEPLGPSPTTPTSGASTPAPMAAPAVAATSDGLASEPAAMAQGPAAPVDDLPAALIDSAPTAAGAMAALAVAASAPRDSSRNNVTPLLPEGKSGKSTHKTRVSTAAAKPPTLSRAQKKATAAVTSASRKTTSAGLDGPAARARAKAAKARRASGSKSTPATASSSAAKLGRPDTVSAGRETAAHTKKAKAPKQSRRRAVRPSAPRAPVPSRPR